MPEKHIPLIMDIIDNIVSPDTRIRKYTDRQILKILILLQIFNISYRSSGIFWSKRIPRKHWTGIGIVKQALENPDLLPIAQEYLMRNSMEKAANMFDRWHSSL